MPSRYPNSTLHVTQPSNINIKISPFSSLPHVHIKMSLHAVPHGLMSELRFLIECNDTPLNFSDCSTFIFTFCISEFITSSPIYHYHKDERAQPGDLRSRKFISGFAITLVSRITPPTVSLSLSLFGLYLI
jgi:hypothetical protein